MRFDVYTREREKLIETAGPGMQSARRLAALTDEALRELAEEASGALGTRGALGRRIEWSLVALGGYGAGALLPASDLDLLVISDAREAALRHFVEELIYPLWDAGLKVGQQVRSPRGQIAAIRSDLKTLTATLTGRVIAGDERLGTEALAECARQANRRSAEVLAELHERPRPGSPYLLEPDLKEGAGGRRDIDELIWTAAVLAGEPTGGFDALVAHGLLSAEEHSTLTQAAETVAEARWMLHRSGAGQVMTLEAAEELETAAVQQALADTHHLLLRVRERVGRPRPVSAALDGPELFALLAKADDPATLAALEDAAWSGRLDTLLPGFRELTTLRRPGLAHTLTVGAHCIAAAGALPRAAAAGGEVAARSAQAVCDPRPLQLAALLHDAGKETPGPGHAGRGAQPARDAAVRCGIPEAADHVAALVALHLELAETAARADLDDASAISECAARIGQRELLAPLHLLTIADSLATGPGAWSDWHAVLIGRLVSRVDAVLVQSDVSTPLWPECIDPVRTEMLADRIAGDRTPGAHALDISSGPIPGAFRVTIAAHDRPGLLATFAGTFALSGLDILEARSLPPHAGVAVDSFVVSSATKAQVGTETWNRVERTLTAALSGRFAVAVRLGERRRHYRPRVEGMLDARIEEGSRGATLHVRAPDRVGLLHDIARAVAESGLDVRSLTATSRAEWAEDTFRLTAVDGIGAGALGQLAMRLREL